MHIRIYDLHSSYLGSLISLDFAMRPCQVKDQLCVDCFQDCWIPRPVAEGRDMHIQVIKCLIRTDLMSPSLGAYSLAISSWSRQSPLLLPQNSLSPHRAEPIGVGGRKGMKKRNDSPSTYMFLVADGSFATIPSTSLVRNTWHPSRDLPLVLRLAHIDVLRPVGLSRKEMICWSCWRGDGTSRRTGNNGTYVSSRANAKSNISFSSSSGSGNLS